MSNWYYSDNLSHGSFNPDPRKKKKKNKFDELKEQVDDTKRAKGLDSTKTPTKVTNTRGNGSAIEAQRSAQRQRKYAAQANARQETIRSVKNRLDHPFDKDGKIKSGGLDDLKKRNEKRAKKKAIEKRGLNSQTTPTKVTNTRGNGSAIQAQRSAQSQQQYVAEAAQRKKTAQRINGGINRIQSNIKRTPGNTSANEARNSANRQKAYAAANPVKKSTAQQNFDRVDASVARAVRNTGTKTASNPFENTKKMSPDKVYSTSKSIFMADRNFMKNFNEYMNVLNYYSNSNKMDEDQVKAFQNALMEAYNEKNKK